jgi:hypothetical protein
MEARMCFELKHGLADISKFYPLPLVPDKIVSMSDSRVGGVAMSLPLFLQFSD